MSLFVCQLRGSKKAGMSQEVSLAVGKSRAMKKMGYPKRCNHLCDYCGVVKIMGYPIIYPEGFGTRCNKKCDRIWAEKRKAAFRKTCFPHKDLSLINIIYPLPIEVESISFTGENC